MNIDSSITLATPKFSRWIKYHTTHNKFGDSNTVQANFAFISGPKNREADDEEVECFPYGAAIPKCRTRKVGIDRRQTALAMSSKLLLSEASNIAADLRYGRACSF